MKTRKMASENVQNVRKKSKFIAGKKFGGSNLGFQSKEEAAVVTNNTGFSSYCFNCWLYEHKKADCRQKNVRAHPNYDHLKPFIAEQKRRSFEDVKSSIDAPTNNAKDL